MLYIVGEKNDGLLRYRRYEAYAQPTLMSVGCNVQKFRHSAAREWARRTGRSVGNGKQYVDAEEPVARVEGD